MKVSIFLLGATLGALFYASMTILLELLELLK